jgi:hypothetical protein
MTACPNRPSAAAETSRQATAIPPADWAFTVALGDVTGDGGRTTVDDHGFPAIGLIRRPGRSRPLVRSPWLTNWATALLTWRATSAAAGPWPFSPRNPGTPGWCRLAKK